MTPSITQRERSNRLLRPGGYLAFRLMKSGSTDEDERCTLDECKDLGELIGSWDLQASADRDSEVFGFLND